MDSTPLPRNSDELLAAVAASGSTPDVDWTVGIEDATRISVENFIGDQLIVRTQASHGLIRLTGDGVVGHAASASDVASVITGFQRLVTAVGASLEAGNTSLRGQIASTIQHRTRLRLVASPAPGSLVLNLSPEAPPEAEVSPGGQGSMFGEATPLADQVVTELVGLLGDATDLGPDPDTSPFLTRVEALGPRSAAALRTFAMALSTGNFDTEVGWAIPQRATVKVSVDHLVAAEVARLVEARNLDAENVTIEGEMRTVSDLTGWVVDSVDGERYQVDGSAIEPDVVNTLHPHARVRIAADMVPTRHVGGSFRYSYLAKSVEVVS
ncbi:MAG: hypothetical protein M3Y77_17340 [Actinomycetota bacterium]|nr:hypothetical protein [Actinomycetota bacterium]MDQ2848069.1 hypothetical protein [Actinomycetota bacterium]